MPRFEGTPKEAGQVIKKALDSVPRLLFVELRKALKADAEEWHRIMLKRLSSQLTSRSKTLARSMQTRVQGGKLDTLMSTKFSNKLSKKYAETQEYGKTITPGPGKTWLTIPVGKALTPRGVPRKKSAREYGDFLIYREDPDNPPQGSPDDVAWLVPNRKRRGGIADAYYILRKRVVIPPRLGMHLTHEAQAKRRAARFAVGAKKALAAATSG